MSTASILVEGLCLWLTATGGARAVVPDFASAIPAHVATVNVQKTQVVGAVCPPGFLDSGNLCSFTLNGMGGPGGVNIELTPSGGALDMKLCPVPRIQHTLPLTLKAEYAPPSGSRVAAQMLVTEGALSGVISDPTCTSDCPRSVEYKVTVAEPISLRLSNLRFQPPVTIALTDGAQVIVNNKLVGTPPTPSSEVADWCLYFTMFEQVGCPGKPPEPECPTRVRRAQTATRAPVHHGYMIETIACSNSQYP